MEQNARLCWREQHHNHMKPSKRPPRKNPYEKWGVDQVEAEMERLERWSPIGRADRWHRTYHLNWLAQFLLDLPTERRPKLRSSLAARLNALRAGMEPQPELDGREA